MTKEETFKILVLIERLYPVVTVNSETVLNWMSHCVSLEFNLTFENLFKHKKQNPYPPTLAQVIGSTGNDRKSLDWMVEYTIKKQ